MPPVLQQRGPFRRQSVAVCHYQVICPVKRRNSSRRRFGVSNGASAMLSIRRQRHNTGCNVYNVKITQYCVCRTYCNRRNNAASRLRTKTSQGQNSCGIWIPKLIHNIYTLNIDIRPSRQCTSTRISRLVCLITIRQQQCMRHRCSRFYRPQRAIHLRNPRLRLQVRKTRQRDRCQHTEDDDHHHQLDQSKTRL